MMRSLIVVGLVITSVAASAKPSVFVRDEPGMAWWLRQMEARILGTAAGSVTSQKVTAYLEATMLYSPYSVCSLEAVGDDTFVGIDRETQAEIDATRGSGQVQIRAVTPDGRRVLAQSVVFEGCYPDDPSGAALLVTDDVTGEILRWEPLGDHVREGRRFPAWVLFLHAQEGDELFSYSSCTECGARTNVYYDVTRNRIYSEYNGH